VQEVLPGGPDVIALSPLILAVVIALGLILNYLCLANSLWLLGVVPLFAIVLQNGVIEPEEAYLERNFGEDYLRYRARVRRWI
jgi:protein-S-isoprenylcysteine O-methyltransferase Ste14